LDVEACPRCEKALIAPLCGLAISVAKGLEVPEVAPTLAVRARDFEGIRLLGIEPVFHVAFLLVFGATQLPNRK
jgi:hypothetical protein